MSAVVELESLLGLSDRLAPIYWSRAIYDCTVIGQTALYGDPLYSSTPTGDVSNSRQPQAIESNPCIDSITHVAIAPEVSSEQSISHAISARVRLLPVRTSPHMPNHLQTQGRSRTDVCIAEQPSPGVTCSQDTGGLHNMVAMRAAMKPARRRKLEQLPTSSSAR